MRQCPQEGARACGDGVCAAAPAAAARAAAAALASQCRREGCVMRMRTLRRDSPHTRRHLPWATPLSASPGAVASAPGHSSISSQPTITGGSDGATIWVTDRGCGPLDALQRCQTSAMTIMTPGSPSGGCGSQQLEQMLPCLTAATAAEGVPNLQGWSGTRDIMRQVACSILLCQSCRRRCARATAALTCARAWTPHGASTRTASLGWRRRCCQRAPTHALH
jgi:hypothetical protein